MTKAEIDVGRIKDGRYYLDIDGERLLTHENLSAIVDRIEKELLKLYGVKKKGALSNLFGK